MGGEFGQFIEWRYYEGLEWKLLDFEKHSGLLRFTRELNHFYKNHKAMHQNDSDWDGFRWINADDSQRNVVSFIRQSRREKVVVVANFAAQSYEKYEIGVPQPGVYDVLLDTSLSEFGGVSEGGKFYKTVKKVFGDFSYTLELDMPPLTAYYLKKRTKKD